MNRDQLEDAAITAHARFIAAGGFDAVRADDAAGVRRALEDVLAHLVDTGQISGPATE